MTTGSDPARQRPKPGSDSARQVHAWNQEGAGVRGKKVHGQGQESLQADDDVQHDQMQPNLVFKPVNLEIWERACLL